MTEHELWTSVYLEHVRRGTWQMDCQREADQALEAYRRAFPVPSRHVTQLPEESFAPTDDRPRWKYQALTPPEVGCDKCGVGPGEWCKPDPSLAPDDVPETPEEIRARVLANIDGGTWFKPGEP